MHKNKLLTYSATLVIAVSILACLPALLVPLGLSVEGDAIDYRIPIIKWILRHHAYPNWPWTHVDDYPMLGELLMLPFYAIFPGFARLVPILGYLGIAFFGACILREVIKDKSKEVFLTAIAWLLCLRPILLQSNLFMVDNLGSCFVLASLFFILRKEIIKAGFFFGMALATRYTSWFAALALCPTLFVILNQSRDNKLIKKNIQFLLIGLLVVSPFLIRNIIVNQNPIYPLFSIDATYAGAVKAAYGRGADLLSLFLFPYDFLITNNFIKSLYDYTLGKLFFLQLIFLLVGLLYKPKEFKNILKKISINNQLLALLVFTAFHFLFWFYGTQQMRFFVPNLVLLNLLMFIVVYKIFPKEVMIFLTISGLLSIKSIQQEALAVALGKQQIIFSKKEEIARDCFKNVSSTATIGHAGRDEVLGFFDHDFVFCCGHDYSTKAAQMLQPDYIYGVTVKAGYMAWPSGKPCLLKKMVK